MHSPKASGDIIEILTQGNVMYFLDTRHSFDSELAGQHPLLIEKSAYGLHVFRYEKVPREQIIIENDETGQHIHRVMEKAPSAVPQLGDRPLYSEILNMRQKMPNGLRMDLLDGATRFKTRDVVKATVLEGETRETAIRELDKYYEELNHMDSWHRPAYVFERHRPICS